MANSVLAASLAFKYNGVGDNPSSMLLPFLLLLASIISHNRQNWHHHHSMTSKPQVLSLIAWQGHLAENGSSRATVDECFISCALHPFSLQSRLLDTSFLLSSGNLALLVRVVFSGAIHIDYFDFFSSRVISSLSNEHVGLYFRFSTARTAAAWQGLSAFFHHHGGLSNYCWLMDFQTVTNFLHIGHRDPN